MLLNRKILLVSSLFCLKLNAQTIDPYQPDPGKPSQMKGYKLVWNDEFNYTGKPDSTNWIYEHGFVRNEELQWYQQDNANCANGILLIEGRKEKVVNKKYNASSGNWQQNRPYAEYTSSSIHTRGLHQWQFGSFEIRARIDTVKGSWPAIWTLGAEKEWPQNGEVDIMEFYRVEHTPTILANLAWGTGKRYIAKWHTERIPLTHFSTKDTEWSKKFHIWRMDWNKDSIQIFLDDELLNSTSLNETLNPDGSNPFLQPHFLLLNLAIGGNGDDPSAINKPIVYEVDYVRVYQKKIKRKATLHHLLLAFIFRE